MLLSRHSRTTVLVVDASVLVVALADDGADGDRVRNRLRGEVLAAPEVIDPEVLSVLRRLHRAGALDARRAQLALTDLIDTLLTRVPHRGLLLRGWELRDNLSAYDACYVALAEALDTLLLTADGRPARAPGLRCPVEVLS